MFPLILKDLVILKRYFFFAVFYILFFFLIYLKTTFNSWQMYVIGASFISIMLIMVINSYDERSHSDRLLNSLPVLRWEIVLCKYVEVILFSMISYLLTLLLGGLFYLISLTSSVYQPNLGDFSVLILLVGAVSSIYYPLYYKWGGKAPMFLNMIFITGITASGISGNQLGNLFRQLYKMNDFMGNLISLIPLIFTLVLLIISYFISLIIYQKKDLV